MKRIASIVGTDTDNTNNEYYYALSTKTLR